MGRAERRRADRRQGDRRRLELPAEVTRCHFDGQRSSCQGAAVGQRGDVPLCASCEAAASSLSRLQRRPLRARPAAAPLEQLRRLRAEQLRLGELVDQVLVEAAAAGTSDAEVGRALGISRQAVRQRRLSRTPDAAPRVPGRPDVRSRPPG